MQYSFNVALWLASS